MNFRGIRLGALLVPLGIALFPVGVLLWYGFAHIPAQEAYLTERNLRLLGTMSNVVKVKIDSYDAALDHAVASFTSGLDEGVHLFAPDLDVIYVESSPSNATAGSRREGTPAGAVEWQLLSAAADPPRVAVSRDEGRYYLYLGALQEAKGSRTRVVARADLEAVVAPLLVDTTQEFAAILLTTDTGVVIAQHSPLSLSLAQVDAVVNARRAALPAKDSASQLPAFSELIKFSNVVPVSIGDVEYKLYLQPVPLSLLSMKSVDKGGREPEQWVLCGLVPADRFKADSSALSYPTLLWFSGCLAVFALALPFVKLRGLSARERLRASDIRWVNTAAFLLVALLSFAALDVLAFWNQFGDAVDTRLASIAGVISKSLNDEVSTIDQQANAFETGSYPDGKTIGTVFTDVSRVLARRTQPFPRITSDTPVRCDPADACRSELVNKDWFQAHDRYPFFDLVTWVGEDGWQRVRYTPGKTFRPFLNIFDDRLKYGERARLVWAAPQIARTKGIEVESSPTTGEPLTVFWRVGGRTDGQDDVKWVQSLAMSNLVSLDHPALPTGVSFAVVNAEGLVLFHSVSSRRLRENFLKECEDDKVLGALIRAGGSGPVSSIYQGRSARFFVENLPLAKTLGDSITEDPKWRLVVFQDSTIVDTVNLETLTIACCLFAGYACVLALTAFAIHAFSTRPPGKWFWPDPERPTAYRSVLVFNLCAILAFAALFLVGTSWPWLRAVLLAVTVTGAVATAVATYWLVTRAKPEPRDARAFQSLHPFFLARAAFLVVIAGLPAIVCFQTAYAFEATLLARLDSAQHRRNQTAEDRSLKAFQSLQLEPSLAQSFVKRRGEFTSNQASAPLWQRLDTDGDVTRAEQIPAAPAVLDRSLLWIHRSYNDVANDLKASALTATAQVPLPALSGVSILPFIAGLCAICCAVVYWLVKPMFALDAVATQTFVPTRVKHVLLVGPPGTGKSTRLAAEPDIRVIDVATQDWVERRRTAVPVPTERRRFVVMGAAVGRSGGVSWEHLRAEPIEPPPNRPMPAPVTAGWPGAFEHSTLPPVLGIDHLNYRLDEREFAAQTLTFVERAVYGDSASVHLASDRDPLTCLREGGATPAEVDRWVRVLRSFKRECVGISKEAAAAFDTSDSPYYESVWNACSLDERLVLRQLAEEGVVNPQSQGVVGRLMQAGLVVRSPALQIVNDSFRDFVLQAATPGQVSAWERSGVAIPWSLIEVTMLTVVVTLAGLLVVTQQQLLNAWIGFIPAFLPAAQKLVRAVAALRSAPDSPIADVT